MVRVDERAELRRDLRQRGEAAVVDHGAQQVRRRRALRAFATGRLRSAPATHGLRVVGKSRRRASEAIGELPAPGRRPSARRLRQPPCARPRHRAARCVASSAISKPPVRPRRKRTTARTCSAAASAMSATVRLSQLGFRRPSSRRDVRASTSRARICSAARDGQRRDLVAQRLACLDHLLLGLGLRRRRRSCAPSASARAWLPRPAAARAARRRRAAARHRRARPELLLDPAVGRQPDRPWPCRRRTGLRRSCVRARRAPR